MRVDAAFRLLRDTRDYPAEMIRPDSEAAVALRALADHYAETGKTANAIALYQELLRKMMASSPEPQTDLPNATDLARVETSLAGLLRRSGRNGEAATIEKRRLALSRQWDRKLPNNPFVLRQIASARSSTAH